jgi:hypothetical protein
MARLRFMSKPEQIFSPPFAWQYTTHVYEPRCSGFQFFVVTHFIAIVSPFRCWFRRIGMRPCGWLASFFHSPAVAQISDSSLKLRLSLKCCELLCCCALWNGTVRPSLHVVYDSEHGSYWSKFSRFFYFGGFIFYFLELHKILDPNRSFTLKMEISLFLIPMSVSEIRVRAATQFGTHRRHVSASDVGLCSARSEQFSSSERIQHIPKSPCQTVNCLTVIIVTFGFYLQQLATLWLPSLCCWQLSLCAGVLVVNKTGNVRIT